jgi:regulator of RNase E activity RraA
VPAKYVADAAEQLTGHRAHMTNEIRLLAGTRLAGPAVTLRIVRDETASRSVEGFAAIKLMEGMPAGSVVVAALDDEKDFAVFGASFAVLAKSLNLAGCGRLGAQPARAAGSGIPHICPRYGARFGGRTLSAGRDECAGLVRRNRGQAGDYVVADEDGVAVAPKDRYQEVFLNAKKMQSEDQAILPLVEKYRSYTKALQERSAAKGKPLPSLRKRARVADRLSGVLRNLSVMGCCP